MEIIKPNVVFRDTEISLRSELKDDKSNSVILLGPGVLAKTHKFEEYKKKYERVIVFNQAQLNNGVNDPLTDVYLNYLKNADEVWDYDEHNIEILSKIRNDIKLHLLRPCKELDAGDTKKDIDVLFYGLVNEHRKKILDELKSKGVKVEIPLDVWGDRLNPYIARSKVCLNIHYYDKTALQEQARMIRWISTTNCNILSEKSRKNYMGVKESEYENLVEECIKLIS